MRAPARAVGFGGITAALLGAYHVHARFAPPERRETLLARYRKTWLRTLLRLFSVELRVEPGLPPGAGARARLVVANHRSALDIAVLSHLFGGQFLSRGDLAGWPLVGAVARAGGTIFVDREERSSRAAAIRAIRRRLREGATVMIFPEGTTYDGDEVRPFHAGAFAAARGLDVEVVSVGLAYEPGAEYREESFLAHLGATAARKRTRLVVCIGQPATLHDDPRVEADRARQQVQQLVHEARRLFERDTEPARP